MIQWDCAVYCICYQIIVRIILARKCDQTCPSSDEAIDTSAAKLTGVSPLVDMCFNFVEWVNVLFVIWYCSFAPEEIRR